MLAALPARQSLETNDLERILANDGLKDEAQFAIGEGAAQAEFDLMAKLRTLIKALVEHADLATSCPLGGIERQVRTANDVDGVTLAPLKGDGGPNRRPNPGEVAKDGIFLDAASNQLFAGIEDFSGLAEWQGDAELVASKPGRLRPGGQGRVNFLPDVPYQFVASDMPQVSLTALKRSRSRMATESGTIRLRTRSPR